jgi:hypothetical protein
MIPHKSTLDKCSLQSYNVVEINDRSARKGLTMSQNVTASQFVTVRLIARAAIGLAVELGVMPNTQPCPRKCGGVCKYNARWSDAGVYECPKCGAAVDAFLVAERVVRGGRAMSKLEIARAIAFMTRPAPVQAQAMEVAA